MPHLLSIDPGLVTGLSLGYYDDKTAYDLEWVAALTFDQLRESYWEGNLVGGGLEVVIERFIPQSGASYTLMEDDLAGVEVIGLTRFIYDEDELHYRMRSQKVIAGTLAMSDEILKAHEMFFTGEQVHWTDGRDVNDSLLHALGYLKDKNHKPTLKEYFRGTPAL